MRLKAFIFASLCALALLCLPSKQTSAQFQGCLPAFCGGSASCATSGTAARFLARTSGLDATHIAAYTALGNSLDAHGLTCKLDMLHIYATQDSTTALLNFVDTIKYNGIAHGAPVFTVDRGFQGIDNSATVYIDTGFTPSTAVATSKYQNNTAHISLWSITNATTAQAGMGSTNGTFVTAIIPRFASDGRSYFAVNSPYSNIVNASGQGHFLADSPNATFMQGYQNGSQILNTINSSRSISALTSPITVLGLNQNGTIFGGAVQAGAASIGAHFTPTDELNFYNDLRAYMTAVGVP